MGGIREISLSFSIALAATTAWSEDLTPQELKLLPEPRLSSFLMGKYEFDERATIKHYNHIFSGRSATEIVNFLEKSGYHVFYDYNDEISFIVTSRVTFFDYSAIIILKFSDGLFREFDVTAWGVK